MPLSARWQWRSLHTPILLYIKSFRDKSTKDTPRLGSKESSRALMDRSRFVTVPSSMRRLHGPSSSHGTNYLLYIRPLSGKRGLQALGMSYSPLNFQARWAGSTVGRCDHEPDRKSASSSDHRHYVRKRARLLFKSKKVAWAMNIASKAIELFFDQRWHLGAFTSLLPMKYTIWIEMWNIKSTTPSKFRFVVVEAPGVVPGAPRSAWTSAGAPPLLVGPHCSQRLELL